MLHRVNRKRYGTINLQTYNNNSINVSFIETLLYKIDYNNKIFSKIQKS